MTRRAKRILWVDDEIDLLRPHLLFLQQRGYHVDAITNGEIDIVFNTTEGAKALADSMSIRRSALINHIPYYTTLSGALAVTEAIKALREGSLTVAPLQSYVGKGRR